MYMHRKSDGSALLVHCTSARLSYPPMSVSRKLKPFSWIELFDSTNKPSYSLLYQVLKGNTSPSIAFGHVDNESQVMFYEELFRKASISLQLLDFIVGLARYLKVKSESVCACLIPLKKRVYVRTRCDTSESSSHEGFRPCSC